MKRWRSRCEPWSEPPLILFIDDLHWADQATLDWLTYLVDRMSDDIELHATAEYLMAVGKLYSRHAMDEADAHYREATHLASEHNLDSDVAVQSWFGWGNLSVQKGEYADARSKFGIDPLRISGRCRTSVL